jgi:hypothetical protein
VSAKLTLAPLKVAAEKKRAGEKLASPCKSTAAGVSDARCAADELFALSA